MPFNNYQDTLDFLYGQLPMFTRIGSAAYKKDLDNIKALCEALDHPERKFKSVHVGGTNGKGSTSHMLSAILQKAGYKVGLHTSPHLKDFRERIRINGSMTSKHSIIEFVNQHFDLIKQIDPSFFELSVAMAFDVFAKEKVDFAVIEVGLGGRLDSTNIIHPLLSIITNIGFDHMDILGNTLPAIAAEKAGIIKENTPVIIGESIPETQAVFEAKAEAAYSNIYFAQNEWEIIGGRKNELFEIEANNQQNGKKLHLELDLTGSYQLKNLPAILVAIDEIRKQGFEISDEHLTSALKQVKTSTGLQGRWQTLQENPKVICDTGHNEDGIREVLKNISTTPHQQLHLVLGMVKDKDISKVLGILPKSAAYYFCQPAIPRAKPVDELQAEASLFGLNGNAYQTVKEAYEAALNKAAPGDLIFIGGSTFVVAEVL
jgi:dihydrofolate synthase/folylpolyglutamate synthase